MSDFEKFNESFIKKYEGKQPPWGFGALSYIVYKRTYSQFSQSEEWWQTLRRVIEGGQEIGANLTKEEAEKLYDYMFNLKCSFGGRILWQLGTDTVRKFGANSLLNCWYINIDSIDSYLFLFDNLMLGGGVGFSVKREHIHEFPKIKSNVKIVHEKTTDADFIVPDSREGWSKLIRKVLESYFVTGESFTYSTILIRSAGEKIKTFGGVSSGPLALIEGVEDICKVLSNRSNKKMRSIDGLDVANILGRIVVSGNVRRGAELAIGDIDDVLFLKAKRWDLHKLPAWRSNSNNSVYCDDIDDLLPHYWDGFKGNGECYGLINMNLAKKYGRVGEIKRDNDVEGFNPCGEQQLAPYECCNLSELFLNNIDNKEEMLECAKLMYKVQKAICNMNYLHDETNKIVHKNNRIGIGITGVYQSTDKLQWCEYVYNRLVEYDKEWSKKNNYPTSIRLTTVKPSGTLSKLSGSSPGGNPAFAKYIINNIRFSTNDPLVNICKQCGYDVEYEIRLDGSINHDVSVISFPCKFIGEKVIVENDIEVEDQMNMIKNLQSIWSDSGVSCTIYFEKDEVDRIKEWLKDNYKKSIKTISFGLKTDSGFVQQMPLVEIEEADYNKMVDKIKDLNVLYGHVVSGEMESQECESGACPVK